MGKKGSKRGRRAEETTQLDVFDVQDELPAEEQPRNAGRRFDVSPRAMHVCSRLLCSESSSRRVSINFSHDDCVKIRILRRSYGDRDYPAAHLHSLYHLS